MALARPGGVLAVIVCLAALLALRRLPDVTLQTLTVGSVSFLLSLPSLESMAVESGLFFGLYMLVLAWWLPRGQGAALWALVALAGLAVPLVLSDPFMAACGLLVAVAALAPALAQGDEDGGAALFVGLSALGVVCIVIGLAMARSAANPDAPANLPVARLLIFAGFALLLGVAPAPFWLPGVSERGHALGAALAAGLLPVATMIVALRVLGASVPSSGWLTSGMEAQAIMPAGVLTALGAALLALLQKDVRRLAGFLLVADLGYTVIGVGVCLQYNGPLYSIVFSQLLGRALAAAVLFPCLTFLTSGFRQTLRHALLIVLACAGCMALGGPLTIGYPARWAVIERVVADGGPWAMLVIASLILIGLAYLLLLVRAARLPSAEMDRPLPRLALALLAAVILAPLFV